MPQQCLVNSCIELTQQKRIRAMWEHKATRRSVQRTVDHTTSLQKVYHSHCKEVLYCSSYFCIFWSCTWWLFPNPDTVGEFSVIHCSLCALQKAISVQTCVRLENAWGASIPRFNILRIATQQLHAMAQLCLLQCTLMQSFPGSWDNGSESLFACWITREMVTKTVWLSKQ